MDYGRLRSNAPIPPSHPAAHSAVAHHHPNPLHHHHHHHHQQQQTLPLSSYYPDRNPSPSPVAKLHNPFSAAAAAPSPADPYVLNPYAPHVGYEGLHAPAAAAPSPAEPYVLNPYAPHGGYEGLHATAAAPYSYPGLGPGATSSRNYDSFGGGGGGGDSHGLTAKEAIRLYGMDPQSYGAQTRSSNGSNGLEPAVPSYQYPTQWVDNTTHPISKQAMRKHPKRIIKVAQSAYCEVCKIDCNSPEVLNTHKQGKKHKKNLLKLQEAITARPAKASATTGKGMEKETPAADKDKDAGEQRRKRAVPATEEELEMKKKRVLEGGAEATEIKVCTICNVVVNSQQVLECHIAGQRHAAMVKKQQSEAGVN